MKCGGAHPSASFIVVKIHDPSIPIAWSFFQTFFPLSHVQELFCESKNKNNLVINW